MTYFDVVSDRELGESNNTGWIRRGVLTWFEVEGVENAPLVNTTSLAGVVIDSFCSVSIDTSLVSSKTK